MTLLKDINLEELASAFDSNGYGLFLEERPAYSIAIEECIIGAIVHKRARLIEGIPVLLSKNKVDYSFLKELIAQYQLWNEFGYLGDFALRHINDEHLRELVSYCQNNITPDAFFSDTHHDYFKKFQKKEQKQWHVIGGPSYSALEKKFNHYCHER
jgi:hypothetical protein